jgi:hypothetical protein
MKIRSRSFEMPKVMVLVAGGLFILMAMPSVPASADTVTGRLIDLACYIQKNPRPSCDRMYAIEGFETGVIAPDGKIYHLSRVVTSDNNAELIQYLGHTVTVTGNVSQKDGQFFLELTGIEAAH